MYWIIGVIILIYFLFKVYNHLSENTQLKIKKPSISSSGEQFEKDIDSILTRVATQTGGKCFRDIMIEINDFSCQIDNILLTNKALYVIESKDYSGWIYGSFSQEYWMQTFAHYRNRYSGKTVSKFKFYNPIKQNQNHIKFLIDKFPQIKSIPIKNFVVFGKLATLKNIQKKTNDSYVITIRHLQSTLIEAEHQVSKEINQYLHADIINGILSANITDPTKRLEHVKRVQKKYHS